MLYSEIKREVLSRINRYSKAGTPIAATYNNQEDYLNRIPIFVNSGIVNIRTTTRRLLTSAILTEAEDTFGGMARYVLPEDFYQLKTGGVSIVRNGSLEKTNNYRLSGRTHILVPITTDADFVVEYYRYPDLLPLSPKGDFNFPEDVDVLQCACTYAAAQLAMYDDEFMYTALYNDYEAQLTRLSNGVDAEVHIIEDAYGFNAGY